jgi:hypothetical protein
MLVGGLPPPDLGINPSELPEGSAAALSGFTSPPPIERPRASMGA